MKTEIEHKYPVGAKVSWSGEASAALKVIGVTLSTPPERQRAQYILSDGRTYPVKQVDEKWTEIVDPKPNYYINVYPNADPIKHPTREAADSVAEQAAEVSKVFSGWKARVALIEVYDDHARIIE